MQLCPQCSHLNDERAKFCAECGSRLPSVATIPSTPPAAPTAERVSKTAELSPEPLDRLDAPLGSGKTQSELVDMAGFDRIDLEAEGEASSSTLFDDPAAPAPEPPKPTPKQTLSTVQPKLVVIRGERLEVVYPIYPGKNYIGRMDEKPVDIDLEGQERPEKIWSSRQHALVHFENGVLMIEDLNSLNGTFVNRVRLQAGQPRTLRSNDIVQVGTVQLRVVM